MSRYRSRFPARGRRRAANTSARLRTTTATSGSGCQIHCNVSASTCRGRKNDTVDALRNPDTSQFLRNRIPRSTQTESNDVCQFRWKGSRKIKISIRRHRGHSSWKLPDTNQAAPAQSILAGRHFTQRRLLFEARIDSSHRLARSGRRATECLRH